MLVESSNSNLWYSLEVDTVDSIAMAEDLKIRWLYRDLLICLSGQHDRQTLEERDYMVRVLSRPTKTLAHHVSERHLIWIEQVKDGGMSLYLALKAWERRYRHGKPEPTVDRLYDELETRFHSGWPGEEVITDIQYLSRLQQVLQALKSEDLPALRTPDITLLFDRCEPPASSPV
ncbi:hypothetical protein BDW59DRAFT_152433 [Aspergillus cavernicola]|uniref:Uncharacterized protein n=1 Tax=Aspergillus cavernicola TaxID=176166 RepID=A0ABR4HQH4_9EURO